jgi:hypothetical protein
VIPYFLIAFIVLILGAIAADGGDCRGRDAVLAALTWPVSLPVLFLRWIVRQLKENW